MVGKQSSPFMRQCLVTAAVSINMMGYGCSFGFPGILLPQLQASDSPIRVSRDQASWLASTGSISMFIGNLLIPAVMVRAGRKAVLYACILVAMLGWFTIILATGYEALLVGRLLKGLSFGMFMQLRSVFIGECSSPRYRGAFLTASALAQSVGLLFVHLTGSLISYQLTALGAISFIFTSLLLTIYSPESPSWLATKGQFEKCRKNFIWLRGEEEIPELDRMIQAVKYSEAQKTNDESKLSEMLAVVKRKEFYKPVILMFSLFLMQSHAGGPLLAAYSVPILTQLMGPDVNAHFWMVGLDCLRLACSGCAIYVINKVKRRRMLFSVGAVCGGSQLCIAVYMFTRNRGLLPFDSLWIPGILISLQTMSLSMGMQPLPAVIAGEVYPLQHRSLAASLGLIAVSGGVFGVLKSFPSLMTHFGLQGTYVLYSVIIISCLGVAWVLLPETRGRTLQQIEEHFRRAPLPELDNDRKEMGLLSEKETLANKTILTK